MNLSSPLKRLVLASLAAPMSILLTAAGLAQAAVIAPTGVSASSWYSTSVEPANLINGLTAANGLTTSGAGIDPLDPLTWTHVGGNGGHWHAGNGTPGAGAPASVDDQFLIFDLGGTYNLTSAYIWNINQTGQNGPSGRGVNQFEFKVSTDGGNNYSSSLGLQTLADAASLGGKAQEISLIASNVTHVRLEINSALSGSSTEYVGLSEVFFEGTAVPEPSSILLAMLGALALLRRRR